MRRLERNGLIVSQMTLGTVQLGLNYGVANRSGQPSADESCRIVEAALGGGVCSFDTAAAYGDSERVPGRCLRDNVPRPTVITKFTLRPDLPASEVERSLMAGAESSMERLGVPVLDMAMLHHAGDLLRWGTKLVEACKQLARSGYARTIGLSFGAEPADTFHRIWEFARDPIFDGVQIPLNVLDQRLIRGGALRLLAESDKLVFARSVFLQGLLLMEPEHVPDHLAEARPAIEKLRGIADREGLSVAQLAIAYVRDMPGVQSLVLGSETAEQVKGNLELMRGAAIREPLRNECMRLFANVSEKIVSPQLWQQGGA